jgi:hypothetical protein
MASAFLVMSFEKSMYNIAVIARFATSAKWVVVITGPVGAFQLKTFWMD